jgi:hypothetical protein
LEGPAGSRLAAGVAAEIVAAVAAFVGPPMPTGGLEAGVAVVDDVEVEAKVLVGDGLARIDVEGPGIAVTRRRDRIPVT